MALNLSLPVLVVDDASTMIRIISTALRQIGFTDIDEVQGGVSALTKMRAKRYGLVISDWNMEPITGIDLRSIVSVSDGRCSFRSQYRIVRSPKPTASAKAFALHLRPG